MKVTIAASPIVLIGVDYTSRIILQAEHDGVNITKYVVFQQSVNRESRVERGSGYYYPLFSYPNPDQDLALRAAYDKFEVESRNLLHGYPTAGVESINTHEFYANK